MLRHLGCVQLSVTVCAVDPQTPLSMGFSLLRYGVGHHALLQGSLPDPGVKTVSPEL